MKNIFEQLKMRSFYVFVIIGFVLIFAIGYESGKASIPPKYCSPENLNFSLFWETLDVLKKNYIDPSKINDQNLTYGAITGMVNSLGDPYTSFFKPEDAKTFLSDVKGSFEGVGMEIGIAKSQLQVISPIEGSPAQKAGIRAGDKILKIDDLVAVDMTVEEAVSHIRGARGTEVVLTLSRDGWTAPKEFKITRAVIEMPSVSWSLKDNNVAYIKIYQFSETSQSKFTEIGNEVLKSKAKKIIVDLRNNPGGYLDISQDIAGWFLKRGQTVVVEDFGGKRAEEYYNANGNSAFINYPVVVLINKGSASASEILAAALRDNRGIKLIGEKSFGKGTVQQLLALSDQSSLKVTIAHWLTPNKNTIHEKGLEPDIKVENNEDKPEEDLQLNKALEIINSME